MGIFISNLVSSIHEKEAICLWKGCKTRPYFLFWVYLFFTLELVLQLTLLGNSIHLEKICSFVCSSPYPQWNVMKILSAILILIRLLRYSSAWMILLILFVSPVSRDLWDNLVSYSGSNYAFVYQLVHPFHENSVLVPCCLEFYITFKIWSTLLWLAVIANGLCKQLCLRMFPQLSRVAFVVELNQHGGKEHAEVGSSNSTEWLVLQREHRVFSYLSKALMSSVAMNCIAKTIGASSTDNFPQESIDNTLEPRDVIGGRYSYWSSNGQSNPNVPETLTYELVSQICLITEINIRPFQGALWNIHRWWLDPYMLTFVFLLTISCLF